ncbi:prenyltransferase [Aestuariirhabdus sp. LZHN29]|uniref:prenyltransferase n=1 Tax=Aestuariirhabdus sp. LZHN29 TaxID=3417462 RepID=UPI003CF54469
MDCGKYSFIKALRPFSFSVALIACGLGVLAAGLDGFSDPLRAALVILAGVLAQATVNLINDHSDKSLWRERVDVSDQERSAVLALISRNTRIGVLCGVVAGLIGLWLTLKTDLGLLALCVVGFLGGYYYTAEPINYKRRGLGVALVFWFTGVLLVLGAYYALTSTISVQALLLSLPIALLSSLLLLSNELRDVEADRQHGLKTLTVRIGANPARGLYLALLGSNYLLCGYLWQQGLLAKLYGLVPSLLFALWLIRVLMLPGGGGERLPPLTGRYFMLFGVGYLFTVYAVELVS